MRRCQFIPRKVKHITVRPKREIAVSTPARKVWGDCVREARVVVLVMLCKGLVGGLAMVGMGGG